MARAHAHAHTNIHVYARARRRRRRCSHNGFCRPTSFSSSAPLAASPSRALVYGSGAVCTRALYARSCVCVCVCGVCTFVCTVVYVCACVFMCVYVCARAPIVSRPWFLDARVARRATDNERTTLSHIHTHTHNSRHTRPRTHEKRLRCTANITVVSLWFHTQHTRYSLSGIRKREKLINKNRFDSVVDRLRFREHKYMSSTPSPSYRRRH